MKITWWEACVGSTNPVKLNGTRRALAQRPDIGRDFSIETMAVQSLVSDQPHSIEETLRGAWHRAEAARFTFRGHLRNSSQVLFLGIESGLMKVEWPVEPRVLDFCVAYILAGDGEGPFSSAYGISSTWELEPRLAEPMLKNWHDPTYTLDHACVDAGFTEQARVGHMGGASALQSGGLLTREDYTFEAVRNALFRLFPRS